MKSIEKGIYYKLPVWMRATWYSEYSIGNKLRNEEMRRGQWRRNIKLFKTIGDHTIRTPVYFNAAGEARVIYFDGEKMALTQEASQDSFMTVYANYLNWDNIRNQMDYNYAIRGHDPEALKNLR